MIIKSKMLIIKSMLYLSAIIQNGTISLTAEENGIKSTNLSKMIKEFEEMIGLKLLTRNQSGMNPTSEGLKLCKLMEGIEDFFTQLQEIQQETKTKQEIKLYVQDSFSVNLDNFSSGYLVNITKNLNDCQVAILNKVPQRYQDYKTTPVNIKNNNLVTSFYIIAKNDDSCTLLYDYLTSNII